VAAAAGAAASRWQRLQGKAPAAVAAAGEGEAQWQQWKERRWWQKKGVAAPSGSRERSGGGRMKRERRQQKGKELTATRVRWGFLFSGPRPNNSGPIV
jgi:hypothetical protein